MKKKIYIFTILFLGIIFIPKNAFALSSSEYSNRHVCPNFELAGAHTDGSAVAVGCYNTYQEAHNAMVSNGASDLIVFDERGTTKIVDAMYALADLMKSVVNFYESPGLNTRKYMAVTGISTFKCADGAFIETNASNYAGKVKFANFTGWISKDDYEIVPINWVKSRNSYTVTNDSIKHNYTSSIQENVSTSGVVIGPKPDMLNTGVYYSYDGHYFYTTLGSMLKDYKNGNYNNAVNKNNPYYNYYMYLSNHSKTTYSSLNIDEYVRSLGYTKSVYGDKAKDGTSKLYGQGEFFYNAQQKYGVNALLTFSLSKNETGNGRSSLVINKNNGFGLNAVDSNVYEGADYFPTYASSIYEYASRWNSYGFSYATDYRYFGPAFGDKMNGMNVKYATDAYWSEKMAGNYYAFDKVFGMNDYNFYQLGITKYQTGAYFQANNSKRIYLYPEAGDQLLIVGESGNYYKVVSDMNIDSNGNLVGNHDDYTKPYNWKNNYVYVLKSDVTLINKAKNGYKSPEDVTNYANSGYSYDLYTESGTLKPKVAKITKDTNYYNDASLTSSTGKKVLKDKLVMVYSAAYSQTGKIIAYLVTSDYFYDQKNWVSADSITFVTSSYGKQTVNISGQYEWVCSKPIDSSTYKIGGLYTNSYVPIVGEEGNWYKVPVSLDSNSNSYGYVLKTEANANVTKYEYVSSNNSPVISASNKTILQGKSINLKDGVSAYDTEDKDITSKIVISGTVNTNTPGEYRITYSVTDSGNLSTTKTITVTVIKDEKPVINAEDKEITVNTTFKELDGVSATDKEDGNITKNIKVIKNTVDTTKVGKYIVTYQVVDSANNKTEKSININVIKLEKDNDTNLDIDLDTEDDLEISDGEFNLENLIWDNNSKSFTISGYLIVLNQNNLSDKEYAIVLENKDTEELYSIDIPSWIKNTPYDLGSENGYSYTNSWFKGKIDFSGIPNGDYNLYMVAKNGENYTLQVLDNFFNQKINKRGEDSKHGYSFKVQQRLRLKNMELSIRDELYTTSEAPTNKNMNNGYDEIKFEGNNLYFYGYSYDYDGIYNDSSKIIRKLIFENTSTYKQVVYDLGSIKGPFEIETLDKKDKTYAWFEKEIDLSKLEKGKYSLMIYTKTSNAANYDEIIDMFKTINEKKVINGKEYNIYYNKDRNNRLEIMVK